MPASAPKIHAPARPCSAPQLAPSRSHGNFILQRTCACGKPSVLPSGECEDCAATKLQKSSLAIGDPNDHHEQEANRIADAITRSSPANSPAPTPSITPIINRASASPVATTSAATAPPIVHSVLNSPGAPLDAKTRADFEPRFGHNFANVRIHTDTEASRSARAVDARAYTVGNHLVFGDNRYAPHTPAGRHLLAHELTHVLQQGATLRRSSISTLDDNQLNLQKSPVLQRAPAIVGFDEAGPKADLTGQSDTEALRRFDQCLATKKADPPEFNPVAMPGWSQFNGRPDIASGFAAVTFSDPKPINIPSSACVNLINPKAAASSMRFQAIFHPEKSWVLPKYKLADKPALNGSATLLAQCQQYFSDPKNAGGHVEMTPPATITCAAGILPAGTRATNAAECETNVRADFTTTAIAESARVLNHEQHHYLLTQKFVRKANMLIDGGMPFDTLHAVTDQTLQDTQDKYDTEAHHGCDATGQAKWEKEIADGLPSVKLPCDKNYAGTCAP